MSSTKQILSKELLRFIAAAVDYCRFLETCTKCGKIKFVEITRQLLPLIYYNYLQIDFSTIENHNVEDTSFAHISEDDYNYIIQNISHAMGTEDEYLEVFLEDFRYSDAPILCTVSESLSDLYQSLREFLEIVKLEKDELICSALFELQEDFNRNWGQKLVNVLRALHNLSVTDEIEDGI